MISLSFIVFSWFFPPFPSSPPFFYLSPRKSPYFTKSFFFYPFIVLGLGINYAASEKNLSRYLHSFSINSISKGTRKTKKKLEPKAPVQSFTLLFLFSSPSPYRLPKNPKPVPRLTTEPTFHTTTLNFRPFFTPKTSLEKKKKKLRKIRLKCHIKSLRREGRKEKRFDYIGR